MEVTALYAIKVSIHPVYPEGTGEEVSFHLYNLFLLSSNLLTKIMES